MISHRIGACLVATCAFALTSLAQESRAHAQPDPFEDYARWSKGEATPSSGKANADAECEGQGDAEWPTLKAGSWSVGLRTQLSYTGTNNEVLEGVDESNNMFFVRLSPSVGYMIVDQVQLALSLGFLGKSVAQERGDDANESDMMIEVTGHYHLPVGASFDVVPGVGIGTYFGSGSRTLGITSETGEARYVDESTSTSGISFALSLGIGYQIGSHFQLRSGLTLNGMFGSESIDSSNASLGTSTAHIGLPVEAFWTF